MFDTLNVGCRTDIDAKVKLSNLDFEDQSSVGEGRQMQNTIIKFDQEIKKRALSMMN